MNIFRFLSVRWLVIMGLLSSVVSIFMVFLIYGLTRFNVDAKITESDTRNIQTNNEYLISEFGGEDMYECFGSCFCEENMRRTSITYLSRGISYLLISISSIAAANQAQKYFETKCQEEFSQECSQISYVKSSVDECSQVTEQTEEIESSNDKSKEKQGERRVYYCFGNCVQKSKMENNLQNQVVTNGNEIKNIDCGQLKQEGELILYESDLLVKTPNKILSNKFLITAQSTFQREYLSDYCKQNSAFEYFWKGERQSKVTGKSIAVRRKRTGFACVSVSFGSSKIYKHGNVKCRLIDPKPLNQEDNKVDKRFWDRKKEWDEGMSL